MKAYLHSASPNCIAVLAGAGEIGVMLETETVDLFSGGNADPRFLSLNPNGLVPVLVDDDFVLWETAAILQYMAVRYGRGLLMPKGERERADVVRWQSWGIAHWQPPLRTFIFENLFKKAKGLGAPDIQAIEAATPLLEKNASILNCALQRHPWLCGEELTVADLSVAAYLIYADVAGVPLDAYPHVRGWWSRLRSRRAWQSAEEQIPCLST